VIDNVTNYKVIGLGKRYGTLCFILCLMNVRALWEEDPNSWEDNFKKQKKIKNFFNLSITTFHKRKKYGKLENYSLCYMLFDIRCLHENKETLIRMFTSNEWRSSRFAKRNDEKIVENVVLYKDFWDKS